MRLLSSGSFLELRMIRQNPDAVETSDAKISYKDTLYLDLISENPGCTMSDLASMVSVTKPTITARINRLTERGMVRREQNDADGRITRLYLTDETRKVYDWEASVLDDIMVRLGSSHSESEMAAFISMLDEASRLISDNRIQRQ